MTIIQAVKSSPQIWSKAKSAVICVRLTITLKILRIISFVLRIVNWICWISRKRILLKIVQKLMVMGNACSVTRLIFTTRRINSVWSVALRSSTSYLVIPKPIWNIHFWTPEFVLTKMILMRRGLKYWEWTLVPSMIAPISI